MKIPVKRYVMDESLSWEERYRQLDAHHIEETTFLVGRIQELEDARQIPETLQDCIEELADTVEAIDTGIGEAEWVATSHHGLGQWIRNNWDLWKTDSTLAKYFHTLGIYHPDDMSGIILTSFWRHIHYLPICVGEQIAHYQKYWADRNVDIKRETLG